jgi:sigma-B regulation protein RsbU (phosphoserine phosphatase)
MRCRPCSDVGGDLVDYAPADGCAALLIADVAGHGISAAMLTTVVKSAFRAAGAARYEPQAVVTAVMDGLAPFGQEKFVTLLSAVVDRAAKTIRYANAGHPPGWIFRRGEVIDELNPTGPLILPGGGLGEIAVARVALPEHAGVLLFTDGLTDAVAPGGQRFDESRLREVVGRFPGGGAALLDGILASADAFCAGEPPRDDITLLTATMGLPGLS